MSSCLESQKVSIASFIFHCCFIANSAVGLMFACCCATVSVIFHSCFHSQQCCGLSISLLMCRCFFYLLLLFHSQQCCGLICVFVVGRDRSANGGLDRHPAKQPTGNITRAQKKACGGYLKQHPKPTSYRLASRTRSRLATANDI